MFKTPEIKKFIGLFLLAFALMSAACSAEKITAQTPRIKVVESPTPEYKPLRRVSRDIIKTDAKPETVKVKAN